MASFGCCVVPSCQSTGLPPVASPTSALMQSSMPWQSSRATGRHLAMDCFSAAVTFLEDKPSAGRFSSKGLSWQAPSVAGPPVQTQLSRAACILHGKLTSQARPPHLPPHRPQCLPRQPRPQQPQHDHVQGRQGPHHQQLGVQGSSCTEPSAMPQSSQRSQYSSKQGPNLSKVGQRTQHNLGAQHYQLCLRA